ncbi:MAG TPA: GSCFA domain-containing protein [Candidatus Coprenecus stercoripullorum]|nr:GSCFA domain-containing protein [Candidatus Coprenecus stercoripullorum]
MKMTEVEIKPMNSGISRGDGIISFGSCFSSEMGKRLADDGYDICNNPFGVLYNPVSIANSISLLESGRMFGPEDTVPRDTNPKYEERKTPPAASPGHRPTGISEGYVSFYHHGSFTRKTPEEFIENANREIACAREKYRKARWVIITFGTAWAYRHLQKGIIVSNCHRHPAWEFRRELTGVEETVRLWDGIVADRGKEFIITVSPIRYKKDGMHGSQVSKATLLLAAECLATSHANVHYFPAYELMLDELRDYGWYAEDLVHPSEKAISYIYEKFKKFINFAPKDEL